MHKPRNHVGHNASCQSPGQDMWLRHRHIRNCLHALRTNGYSLQLARAWVLNDHRPKCSIGTPAMPYPPYELKIARRAAAQSTDRILCRKNALHGSQICTDMISRRGKKAGLVSIKVHLNNLFHPIASELRRYTDEEILQSILPGQIGGTR